MARTWLAFAWLFLLSGYLARGKDALENTDLAAAQKNASISSVEVTAQTMFVGEPIKVINHWAELRTYSGEYYGARASFSVHGLPTIKNGQISSMQIWVINGFSRQRERFNLIQIGWHVHPELYGDHDTHFFVRWTADQNYKTGCFNFDCKGFIPDDKAQLIPGYRLQPLSEYNGVQRFITLTISKNGYSGDWWLHSGPEGRVPVGHWPRSLFHSLANSASDIHIGGVASFPKGGISPPMGSGHAVFEGEGRAASIKHPSLMDRHGQFYAPNPYTLDVHYDRVNCYSVGGNLVEGIIYVGGPGGCKD